MAETRSILLVLDMINDLVHEGGAGRYRAQLERRNVVENTVNAIQRARNAAARVGYVRIGFSPDYRECPPNSPVFSGARKAGMFKLGAWGTEVYHAFAPQPGDFDIVKHRVSPFYGTALEPILRANSIHRLFLCGISTGGAVASGARDGHDRDYEVFVLEDCCCALAEEEHASVIANLRRYATITTSRTADFSDCGVGGPTRLFIEGEARPAKKLN